MPETTFPEFETRPEWHEPFPEPNTIPAGWDMSAVPAGDAQAEGSAEVEG
jgi:hypothetical protein